MLGWDILNYLKMCRANLRATKLIGYELFRTYKKTFLGEKL